MTILLTHFLNTPGAASIMVAGIIVLFNFVLMFAMQLQSILAALLKALGAFRWLPTAFSFIEK